MKHLLKRRRALTDFTKEIGCKLSEPPEIFTAVYAISYGHPCDECGYNTSCEAIKHFNSEDSNTVSGAWFKTNAEIAKELGVSKRQASKLKRKDIERYS